MSEVWKPVVGHDGYEVSNLGRVRSVDRTLWQQSRGGRAYSRFLRGRILKPSIHPRTRHRLVQAGKGNWRTIHTLVAEMFIGPRPAGQVVRHLRGVECGDGLANLAYGTQGDNNRDAVKHGTFLSAKRLAHLRRIAPLGGKASHA